MSYSFLVIDSNPGFSVLVKGFLSSEWPDVTVDSCDVTQEGWPDASTLLNYHAIFLSTAHETDRDGLDWLKQYAHAPNFPKCVITNTEPEPSAIDAEAITAGAIGFYSKIATTRDGMVNYVKQLINAPTAPQQSLEEIGTVDTTSQTIGYDFKSDAKIDSPFSQSNAPEPHQKAGYDFPDLELDDLETSPPTPSLGASLKSAGEDEKDGPAEELLSLDETGIMHDDEAKAEDTPEEPEPSEDQDDSTNSEDDDSQPETEKEPPKAPAVQRPKLRLNGYILEKKIAEGGMSSIYFCIREEDGQPAVLKTISPKLAGADKLKIVERTHLEYEVISRIKHPNVVRLYDHGSVKDIVYTTMEYFSTGDLKQRMHKGITQRQGLSYMLQIAEGLNAIHGCGIIHRDLKPANIMFRDDETLAILDFGIAKDITRKLNLTPKGMRLGTPSYMSPEQGNKGYHPGATSDLYSLGVILYEMLTKERPYKGTAKEVVRAHINEPLPTLPNQFYELQPLLERLMAKFPHERFESAYDLNMYIKEHFRFDATLSF